MSHDRLLALAAGSLTGGLARYALAGWVQRITGPSFPYGTLAVNLSGCFLIGLLSVLAEEKAALGPAARILLLTGFCGAFTTFSTWILETGHLFRDGDLLRAFGNLILSVTAGFLLFRAGAALGRLI